LSFDPKETPDLALHKKAAYLGLYDRAGTETGWHFLTADAATIEKLTKQVGFSYKWDEEHKQWAHASAAIVLTPQGRVARYLHGILFDPPTVKMALNEASGGKIGTIVDKMIWYCFHYDPHQSKYTVYASRLMQLGGYMAVLVLAAFLIPAWFRSRRQGA